MENILITYALRNRSFNPFALKKCGLEDSISGGSPYQSDKSANSGGVSSGEALIAGGAVAGSLIAGNAQKDAAQTAADSNLSAVQQTNAMNMQNFREQRDYDYRKWKELLSYHDPSSQITRYKKAGINPYLALSNIDSGNVSSYAGGQTPPTLQAPQLDVASYADSMSAPLRGLVQGFQNGANYLQTMQQVHSASLDNAKKVATMVDEVNSIHYDSEAKKMTNQLFNATLEDNIQIIKQQRAQMYLKTSSDALLQVGSEYDLGMKRFQFENTMPLEYRALEAGLAQTCAEISYRHAQTQLTFQQMESLIQERAQGWARLSLDWYNAHTQRYTAQNNAWNQNQATYRENFKFNQTKNLFVKQIKLGVQQLQDDTRLKHFQTNYRLSFGGRFAYGLNDAISSVSPFKGSLGF